MTNHDPRLPIALYPLNASNPLREQLEPKMADKVIVTHPKALRLLRVIHAIGLQLRYFTFRDADEGAAILREVALAQLRGMMIQGRAVGLLADSGTAEAAYSNLRSLFEIFIDFKYLVLGDSAAQQRKARRVRLYADRDVNRFFADEDKRPELRAELDEREARVRTDDPALFTEFDAAWKATKMHWSGMSRVDIMKEELDTEGKHRLRRSYKVLSWESHGVISPVTDVHRTEDGLITQFDYRSNQSEIVPQLCDAAARFLLQARREIRSHGWWPAGPRPLLLRWVDPASIGLPTQSHDPR